MPSPSPPHSSSWSTRSRRRRTVGWTDAQTVGSLVAAAVLAALFLRLKARSAAPLVPLRIFRSRTLVGGNLVLLVAGATVDGMLIIVTLYAQEVLGYSTVQFGLGVGVMTVASVGGAVGGQVLVTRIGLRAVAVAGTTLIAVACLLLTQISVEGSYFDDIFLGLLLFGAGLGATFVASQIAGLSGVDAQESGLAAGLVDASFNVGSALGIAVLSSVAVARTDAVLAGARQPVDGALAMTEGFQDAFLVALSVAIPGRSSRWRCSEDGTRPTSARHTPPMRSRRARRCRRARSKRSEERRPRTTARPQPEERDVEPRRLQAENLDRGLGHRARGAVLRAGARPCERPRTIG